MRSEPASVSVFIFIFNVKYFQVYDDGLSSDWEDWSYFSKVFMKAKKPFQGTNSIKLTLQPFGALRLHAKFDISSFDSLEMWISRKVSKKQTMQLAGSSPPIDLNVILGVFPEPKFIDAVKLDQAIIISLPPSVFLPFPLRACLC